MRMREVPEAKEPAHRGRQAGLLWSTLVFYDSVSWFMENTGQRHYRSAGWPHGRNNADPRAGTANLCSFAPGCRGLLWGRIIIFLFEAIYDVFFSSNTRIKNWTTIKEQLWEVVQRLDFVCKLNKKPPHL